MRLGCTLMQVEKTPRMASTPSAGTTPLPPFSWSLVSIESYVSAANHCPTKLIPSLCCCFSTAHLSAPAGSLTHMDGNLRR